MAMFGKIGFRIRTDIERAQPEQIKALGEFSSANLSDGLDKFYTMDSGIHQLFPAPRMAGTAVTVKVRSADNLMLHKAISLIGPGDVLVIDTQGCVNYSLMGELMASCMKKSGLCGVVADGCVRDLSELRELGMPVFARGTTPAVGDKDGPGEINVPVCCGGVVVMPGDAVVGDEDGVVVVPREEIDSVIAGAGKKTAYEEVRREEIRDGILVKATIDQLLAGKGLILG